VQVGEGEDLRTYIKMAVALGAMQEVCVRARARKLQRANLKQAIMRENRRILEAARGGEFGTALRDAFMREKWARREPRGDASAPPWPGKRSDSAAGRGVNGFDDRCGLNGGV
jgi:hypothetical protein